MGKGIGGRLLLGNRAFIWASVDHAHHSNIYKYFWESKFNFYVKCDFFTTVLVIFFLRVFWMFRIFYNVRKDVYWERKWVACQETRVLGGWKADGGGGQMAKGETRTVARHKIIVWGWLSNITSLFRLISFLLFSYFSLLLLFLGWSSESSF